MNTNNQPREMMKFTETIKIEVLVQDIANMLLKQFPEDYKHKELVTEAIIATAESGHKLPYIYNALCGFTPDVDFEVGNVVKCVSKSRRTNVFEIQKLTGEETTEEIQAMKPIFKESIHEEIGVCEVIEINPYESFKLKVQYEQEKYRSTVKEMTTEWVDHRNCSKVPQYPQLAH